MIDPDNIDCTDPNWLALKAQALSRQICPDVRRSLVKLRCAAGAAMFVALSIWLWPTVVLPILGGLTIVSATMIMVVVLDILNRWWKDKTIQSLK